MADRAAIVVLNWNGLPYVERCLESTLDQTYPDVRVITVDNASTDGSRERIGERFPEVDLIALPENLHFARGTNAGMRRALKDPRVRYVLPLNNDTRVDPEWVAEMVRAAAGSGVGSVAAKIRFMDHPEVLNSAGIVVARDGSGRDRGWMRRDGGMWDEPAEVFGSSAGAALYRRELLETVGLFDEDFVAYYEDLDLAWRARLAGWTGRYAPRAVVDHKYSASTSPRSLWKSYMGERNRVWVLVQNFPLRSIAVAVPWNAAKSTLGLSLPRPEPLSATEAGPSRVELAGAFMRARLEAYAGLRRAWRKRAERWSRAAVTPAQASGWIRRFGMTLREIVS